MIFLFEKKSIFIAKIQRAFIEKRILINIEL